MSTSVGIVFGQIDPLTQDVLSYLVTYQNDLQKTFEFRLLPCPPADPFVRALSASPLNEYVSKHALDFADRVLKWNKRNAEEFDLKAEPTDTIVLLTDSRLADNYYYLSGANWAVVALGGWKNEFAPPSIVEYYLSLLVTAALDSLGALRTVHYETRGCISDFNANLHDARLAVMSGRICQSCAAEIERGGSPQVVEDALILLQRSWLGDPSNPSEIALNVKKLGYDLFRTAGVSPTLKERWQTLFEQEGLKNFLTFTFQFLLAVALVIFGLKK